MAPGVFLNLILTGLGNMLAGPVAAPGAPGGAFDSGEPVQAAADVAVIGRARLQSWRQSQ